MGSIFLGIVAITFCFASGITHLINGMWLLGVVLIAIGCLNVHTLFTSSIPRYRYTKLEKTL